MPLNQSRRDKCKLVVCLALIVQAEITVEGFFIIIVYTPLKIMALDRRGVSYLHCKYAQTKPFIFSLAEVQTQVHILKN